MSDSELAQKTGFGVETARRLNAYAGLIHKWNRGQNLTSVRNLKGIVDRHLLDVIPLVRALPKQPGHVADIGSGAGTPGIPIAICMPQAKVTLVESRRKRAVFLRQCRIELELDNVEVFHGRAEDWKPEQPPSLLVSRATASLDKLAGMTAHLFVPSTRMLVLKGNDPEEEIGRISAHAPFRLERVKALEAPQSHYMVCLAGNA